MGRKDLGQRSRFSLLERLDLLAEVDKRGRVVAGLVHVLEAQHVGLGLKSARERQEAERNRQASALANGVPGPAAHENQRNGSDVDDLSAGRLARAMTGGHMRDLMRHDTSQFGFAVRLEDQAGVYEEEPTGQREGVDLFGIENLDGERNL